MAVSSLALKKEASIIKLFFLSCPLIPAYYITDKLDSMTELSRFGNYDALYATKKMAIDFDM